MNTLTEVLKMFPVQMSLVSKPDSHIKQKTNTIASCFSEGIKEGCKAFTIEMGHENRV